MKPIKATPDETQPKIPVQPPPPVQRRPSARNAMTRSMTISSTEPPSPSQTNNLDSTNDSSHVKPLMSASLFSTLVLPNNNNEQKDSTKSTEPNSPQPPQITPRPSKAPGGGTRVLPVLDPNGEALRGKLRQVTTDRKGIKQY